MKTLNISYCFQCPYNLMGDSCVFDEDDVIEFSDEDPDLCAGFPDWCPLKDVE